MKIELIEDVDNPLMVEVHYPQMNLQVKTLVQRISQIEPKVVCFDEQEKKILALEEIYYAESVDRKTFLYTKDQVYRSNSKIYQLIEEWKDQGFIQAGKASLVNMNRMVSVKALWNSRLEAVLDNGEKVIISRTFIKDVKTWLDKEEIKDED